MISGKNANIMQEYDKEIKLNCPLYKKGLYIEKNDNHTAYVGMCCDQVLSNETYDIVDFYNNDYLNSVRNSNITPKECKRCVITERNNLQSYRIGQKRIFESNNILLDDTTELISFSYNCENVCNLKCITCGPRYSSLWKPEYKKLGYSLEKYDKKISGNNNVVYQSLPLDKIQFLHFQGGEPFLTDDHINILKEMEKQGCDLNKVTLSYNTNGTVFPNEEIISMWKKVKLVKIYFSIDAIGDQFEYIRYPAKWNQVEKNMFDFRDLNISNMWIELGITVSKANLLYLTDIINWKNTRFPKLLTTDPIQIYMTFADRMSRGGEVLSLDSINLELKTSAIEYLETIPEEYSYLRDSIINKLETALISTNLDWVDYLTKIDSFRNTNWKQSLSKLSEYVYAKTT